MKARGSEGARYSERGQFAQFNQNSNLEFEFDFNFDWNIIIRLLHFFGGLQKG